jgi:hypothetical protein
MNQENDATYLADATRTGGAQVGTAFPSPLGNKIFYQLTTFVAALAGMLAAKGYDTSDADISALQTVLANIKTAADFRAPLAVLTFSATPAYNAGADDGFQMQLTGNVTGPTITGQTAGQVIRFAFQQDGAGGRTVAWPAGVVGGPGINPAPNAWTIADFLVTNDLALRLISVSPGLGMTDVTGARAFGTDYTPALELKTVTVSGSISSGVGHTASIQAKVNGTIVATDTVSNGSGFCTVSFRVPAGATYRVNTGGIGAGDNSSATLGSWIEWS